MFRLPINEQGWGLFSRLVVNFRKSKLGPTATYLFVSLIVLLIA
ncbi:MAG: hypothetical protein RLZZ09_2623, partial [Pseudomonadota bacterium]